MSKSFNDIFSGNLRYYLSLRQKSQADLAKYMGVSTAATNTWCKGSKVPRMDKIDKICVFLNIKRSDLMEDREESVSEPAPDLSFFIQAPDGTSIPLLLERENPDPKHWLDTYDRMLNISKRIIEAYNSADDITQAMVLRALGLEDKN